MLQHLRWLWAMHLARRVYKRSGMLFSRRQKFLTRLAPRIPSTGYQSENTWIAYPDAIFFIKPADVRRAEREVA